MVLCQSFLRSACLSSSGSFIISSSKSAGISGWPAFRSSPGLTISLARLRSTDPQINRRSWTRSDRRNLFPASEAVRIGVFPPINPHVMLPRNSMEPINRKVPDVPPTQQTDVHLPLAFRYSSMQSAMASVLNTQCSTTNRASQAFASASAFAN